MAGVPAPGGLFGRARAETCLVSPETQDIGPVMIKYRRSRRRDGSGVQETILHELMSFADLGT